MNYFNSKNMAETMKLRAMILFMSIVFATRLSAQALQTVPLTKNEVYTKLNEITEYPHYLGYIKISDIRPGQIRYSQSNVDSKIAIAFKKKYMVKVGDSNQPQFFSNTSIVPEDQALPVVAGPQSIGLVLVDGHHDTIASLQAGATTIPIKIVADLHTLKPTVFWQEAAKRNLIYPYDINGKHVAKLPSAWTWGDKGNLKDDTNRYFAAIAARKCAQKGQAAHESTGAEYPLWVKIGKDIPFIEFMISDVLTKAGIQYTNAMGEDLEKEPLKTFVEQAREVLNKNPIKGLKLVPERTYFLDINNGDLCSYEGPIG